MQFDTAIIGLGATGYSCAEFFGTRQISVVVTDNRPNPPFLSQLRQKFPQIPVYCGEFSLPAVAAAKRIMLSQGIHPADPVIQQILAFNKPIISDIEIFANATQKPRIAITGSNGKSTVTSLVGAMAKACGCQAAVGGNLGPPALTLLREPEPECYILEISNFQLETTEHLRPRVACILNISPDHLDRYPHYSAYIQAKRRIYHECEIAVMNRDDPNTWIKSGYPSRLVSFGLTAPGPGEFGILQVDGQTYLAFGQERLLATSELALFGQLNWQNSLAALAIGYAYGWPLADMVAVLRQFQGLPHRCQLVRQLREVRYINDSKGTNVGATLAALKSIGMTITGKLIWLAGGDGKGADFCELAPVVNQYVKHALLFGRDALNLAQSLSPETPVTIVADLADAVAAANSLASPGDAVLLSPACASFDMFKDFQDRGDSFRTFVEALPE